MWKAGTTCFTYSRSPFARVIMRVKSDSTLKPTVVIIGSGWGGYRAALDLDKTKFRVVIVSPRNHFLFTPLLPSTAGGTLEFRCIQVTVVV